MGGIKALIDSTIRLTSDSADASRLKSARPLFETASRAAAEFKSQRGPSGAYKEQLERVLRGEFVRDGDDLEAVFIAEE